jgi:hypothetical protein
MSFLPTGAIKAEHTLTLYPADALRVTDGVHHGDAMGDIKSVCFGDSYTLRRDIDAVSLKIAELPRTGNKPVFKVNEENAYEVPGTRLEIAARLIFMTAIGASVDVLLLAFDGPVPRYYIHPLGPFAKGTEYMLIKARGDVDELPVDDLTGISFARGTRITTDTGAQVPVEDLSEGDKILTRDHGMQPIRWIGSRTVQGVGSFAPVVIGQGALGNSEALVISQTHRMMLSDWRAEVMTGSKDVLIEAQDLLNDKDIYLRAGGFVEYIQLAFDTHQIIYAEGVATESLHLTPQILSGMEPDLAAEVLKRFPKLPSSEPQHSRTPLNHVDARTFLRQSGRL